MIQVSSASKSWGRHGLAKLASGRCSRPCHGYWQDSSLTSAIVIIAAIIVFKYASHYLDCDYSCWYCCHYSYDSSKCGENENDKACKGDHV